MESSSPTLPFNINHSEMKKLIEDLIKAGQPISETLSNEQQEKINIVKTKINEIVTLSTDSRWKQAKAKGDFASFNFKDEGGRIVSKSTGIMTFTPIEILAYVGEMRWKNEYDELFDTSSTIEVVSPTTDVLHWKFKPKFPASKRDFCLIRQFQFENDGTIKVVSTSIEHPKAPVDPKFVRGNIVIGGWILKPHPKGTEATYISQIDLKGKIPKLISNMVAKKQGSMAERIQEKMSKKFL